MDKKNIHPPLKKLESVFKKFPEVIAVYLFGSVANGRANRESDLDLGIVLKKKGTKNIRLDILKKLAEEGFCNVDIVFINDDSDIVTAYEAVKKNILIYYTDNFDRGEFYSKIVRKYLDILPYLDYQRKVYKDRILNGK